MAKPKYIDMFPYNYNPDEDEEVIKSRQCFPKCVYCGGRIVKYDQEIIGRYYSITKTGHISKRALFTDRGYDDIDYLECMECHEKFEYHKNDKGEVIIDERLL